MLKNYLLFNIYLFLSSKISYAGALYGKGELKMTENAINGFMSILKLIIKL